MKCVGLLLLSALAGAVASSAGLAPENRDHQHLVPPQLRSSSNKHDLHLRHQDEIEVYPTNFYNYIPLNDGYGSNFFYKIETVVPSKEERAKLPLILWLQGGPGGSSLFGAYCETGAKLMKIDRRSVDPKNGGKPYFEENPFTWAKYGTVLYVDNPIGTGFSYTNNTRGFSTTDSGIADNLVKFMRSFLARHPEYVKNEFHIFSESYGGKMAAFFGNALAKEVLVNKSFPAGFKIGGVALGDGWLDPVACMESYGEYLFSLGQISEMQRYLSDQYAMQAAEALAIGNGIAATANWRSQQNFLSRATNDINWYNALVTFSYLPDDEIDEWLLRDFPNLPEVKQDVKITSRYGAQSNEVFSTMANAFMGSGISEVESLLNMSVNVSVYVGEVDLIVNPLCTRKWVNKISSSKWEGMRYFRAKSLEPFTSEHTPVPAQVIANRQRHENLQLWTVRTAGHMVPTDTPLAAEIMLAAILGVEPKLGSVDGDETKVRALAEAHERSRSDGAKTVQPGKLWKP